MVTIKDIARESGVSITTVSMVLNQKEGISDKTRSKVLMAAEKLNYVPSATARSLKTRRSNTIGIIIGQLSNSYSTDIIVGAEEVARQFGYDIFVCNAELNTEKAIQSLRALNAREVDGILLSVFMHSEKKYIDEIQSLINSGTHVVSLTRTLAGNNIPIVSFIDDEQVGQSITRLVALGHRKIGVVAAPKGSALNYYRLEAFKRVTQEFELFNSDYIVYSEVDMYRAKESAVELLSRHPEITAIYAANDMIALGVLQAAAQLKLNVPEDLSIIGSDGIPFVNFTTPSLTTIMTPRYEIGELGARKLIDLIEGREINKKDFLLIPCTCTEGGSVTYPRQRG